MNGANTLAVKNDLEVERRFLRDRLSFRFSFVRDPGCVVAEKFEYSLVVATLRPSLKCV
jgi:hypothetical protein